jgi:opacity protein-like surface antigen
MKKLLAFTVLTAGVLSSASSAVMAQDSGATSRYDAGSMWQPFAQPALAMLATQARHRRLPTQVQRSDDWLPGGYSPRVDIE